jgi:hypothetical protein
MLIINFDLFREGGEFSENSVQDDGPTQLFQGTSSSTIPRQPKSSKKFIIKFWIYVCISRNDRVVK